MADRKPTIGLIVTYRTDGRNGLVYDLPAMINCTRDTHPGDYPTGEKNPLPVPESDMHVHLTVFTPGGFGTIISQKADNALGAEINDQPNSDDFPDALALVPGSGTYVEHNVPFNAGVVPAGYGPHPRTWRWQVI